MKKRLQHVKNQKGLTLVELLAVLVILGIIAAIAFPLITNVIKESNQKGELNDALNIIAAAKLADAEGDGTTSEYTVKTLYDNGYLDNSYDGSTTIKAVKSAKGQWSISGYSFEHNTDLKDKSPTETELKQKLKTIGNADD